MARNLTENQQKFLNVLFEEAAGDVVLAKKLAGQVYTAVALASAAVAAIVYPCV